MSAAAATTANGTDKAAFVERFDAGWRGGGAGFLDRFLPDLVEEDVVLAQPLLPPAHGHDGFRALFEDLFAAIPDLRGEVRGWVPEHDGVTIELVLRGTLDGLPLEFVTHDRIVLRDGRIASRDAQMDVRPLLAAVARRPRAGLALLAAPLRRQLAATSGLDRALVGLTALTAGYALVRVLRIARDVATADRLARD